MAADVLAPFIVRSSEAMMLKDKWLIVFHVEGSKVPVPSLRWEINLKLIQHKYWKYSPVPLR